MGSSVEKSCRLPESFVQTRPQANLGDPAPTDGSMQLLVQRLANLQKLQLNGNKVKSKQQDRSKELALSASSNSLANTPQEYSNDLKSFPSRSPSQGDEEDSALILTQDNLKSSDPDLSANSDQESGVEDLSCRSPSAGGCLPSEDSGKDSDEAVCLAV